MKQLSRAISSLQQSNQIKSDIRLNANATDVPGVSMRPLYPIPPLYASPASLMIINVLFLFTEEAILKQLKPLWQRKSPPNSMINRLIVLETLNAIYNAKWAFKSITKRPGAPRNMAYRRLMDRSKMHIKNSPNTARTSKRAIPSLLLLLTPPPMVDFVVCFSVLGQVHRVSIFADQC